MRASAVRKTAGKRLQTAVTGDSRSPEEGEARYDALQVTCINV